MQTVQCRSVFCFTLLHIHIVYISAENQQIRQEPPILSAMQHLQRIHAEQQTDMITLVFAYTAICQHSDYVRFQWHTSPPIQSAQIFFTRKVKPFPTKLTNRFWLFMIEKSYVCLCALLLLPLQHIQPFGNPAGLPLGSRCSYLRTLV